MSAGARAMHTSSIIDRVVSSVRTCGDGETIRNSGKLNDGFACGSESFSGAMFSGSFFAGSAFSSGASDGLSGLLSGAAVSFAGSAFGISFSLLSGVFPVSFSSLFSDV